MGAWAGGPWPRRWPLSLSLSLSAQVEDARPAQSAGTRTTRATRIVASSAPKETPCTPDGSLRGKGRLVGGLDAFRDGLGGFPPARQQAEEQRYEPDGDEGRGQHPADDAGADRMAAGAGRAGAAREREQAGEEGGGRPEDGPGAAPGGFAPGVIRHE